MGAALGAAALLYPALPSRWAPLALLAVAFPFVAAVAGNLRRLVLAGIVFDAPLQLDVYLGPHLQDSLFGLQAFILSFTTVGLAILYAQWLVDGALRPERARPRPAAAGARGAGQRRSHVGAFLGAYLVISLLSLVVARDLRMSLYEVALLAQMALLFLYLSVRVRSRTEVLFLARMLLLSAVLESLLMIAVLLVGHDVGAAGITSVVGEGGRVAGTTGSYNRAASFLNIVLMLAVAVLLSRLGRADKLLAAAALALGAPALVLTLSRGGWISFLLALAVVLAAAWRRGRVRPAVPLFLALGLATLFLAFRPTIEQRLAGADASPVEVRVQLMRLADRMIRDHPLTGVGLNNYGVALKDYLTPEFAGAWIHEVHNKYLLVWAETGAFGVLAFVLFLLAALREAWGCWRRDDGALSFVALGLGAGVLAHAAQMFTERFVSRSQIQSLWLVAGLIVAIGCVLRALPAQADGSPSGPAPGTGGQDAADAAPGRRSSPAPRASSQGGWGR